MSIDNFWVAEREYNPEEAYFNEADGLYYCVDCRTPVEAYFAEKEKGKHPCMFGSMEEHKQASFCNAERSYYGRTSE